MKNLRYLLCMIAVIMAATFACLGCSNDSSGDGGNGGGNGDGSDDGNGSASITCTVTFNSNGGSDVVAQTINNGEFLVLPSSPVKDGYIFSGWYKEASLSNLWNFDGDAVNSDMTLYAKWVAQTNLSNTLKWGVNIHDGGSDPQTWANKLSGRNITSVRMDYYGKDQSNVTKVRNAITAMNSKGIDAQVIVFTDFSRDQPRWQEYDTDLAIVEQTAYNDAKSYVEKVVDLVTDFEMSNEVPLYPGILKETDTYGQVSSDFDTEAGRFQAAHLKGVSRAIRDVATETGKQLRIILGTVNRYYGFLKFMQENGVEFDVVGYHIYPWENHAALDQDPWFGQGGPIGQLAQFNKPIHINEFNSGEIYAGMPGQPETTNYENQVGKDVTERGFRGLYKHLNTIVNQKLANIESVHFYEACDEPHKSEPENRFGLYYDTSMEQPKISLLIATAFAGGPLTDAEKDQLYARGFTYYNNVNNTEE